MRHIPLLITKKNLKMDLMESSAHVRLIYKLVKDSSRTAYDVLPCGKTLGEYANMVAIARYQKKNWRKREQARAARANRKKQRNAGSPSSPCTNFIGNDM